MVKKTVQLILSNFWSKLTETLSTEITTIFFIVIIYFGAIVVFLIIKVAFKSRYTQKIKKIIRKNRKIKTNLRKKRGEIKRKKIIDYLAEGDNFIKKKQLKNAFYRYTLAKQISNIPRFKDLYKFTVKRLDKIKEKVINLLIETSDNFFRKVGRLLDDDLSEEVLVAINDYKRFIQKYEWIRIDGNLVDFNTMVADHYKEIFPRMVSLTDQFFDQRDYSNAKKYISECMDIIREFNFRGSKSYHIGPFMRYERLCEERMIMAQMYELLFKAEISTRNQEISDILFTIRNLENSIPLQFRDREGLHLLHMKMDIVRKKLSSS